MKLNTSRTIQAAALFVVLGSAFGITKDAEDAFMDGKVKEWFTSARPIAKVPFVTDAKGCLYGLTDGQNGPALIAMIGKDNKPLCKAQ